MWKAGRKHSRERAKVAQTRSSLSSEGETPSMSGQARRTNWRQGVVVGEEIRKGFFFNLDYNREPSEGSE